MKTENHNRLLVIPFFGQSSLKRLGLNSFFVFILICFLSVFAGFAQVRNGWRSVYDTQGRLTRMSYYVDGEVLADSNYYFQYHSDQIVKGLVKGELSSQSGCKNGSVFLFNTEGFLVNYNINNQGQKVLNVTCDDFGNCTSTWSDTFDAPTDLWIGDSMVFSNGEIVLYDQYNLAAAIYNPPVPIDISRPFNLQLIIPRQRNSAKQGIVLGWKDPDNYYLFEISYGQYFSALYYENGVPVKITEPRRPMTQLVDDMNVLKIANNGKTLIFELNGVIELVIPTPKFKGDYLGLVSRARGAARFSDIKLSYPMDKTDQFYRDKWIGKGTGFFISHDKILTTFENILQSNMLRIKGSIDGKPFVTPVEILQIDEAADLAILQLTDTLFNSIDFKMIGVLDKRSVEDQQFISLGYPHALSGIFDTPQSFEGKISARSRSKVVEIPFRYGMIGSPVFDQKMNFVGVVNHKSNDINYSEIIDFYDDSFKNIKGISFAPSSSSLIGMNKNDQIEKLSNLVVIIESYIFESESNEN